MSKTHVAWHGMRKKF